MLRTGFIVLLVFVGALVVGSTLLGLFFVLLIGGFNCRDALQQDLISALSLVELFVCARAIVTEHDRRGVFVTTRMA